MASIIHTSQSDFQANPDKIDGFRLLTESKSMIDRIHPHRTK